MDWMPLDKYMSDVLIGNENLSDTRIISQFVDFHNLPLQFIDLCVYAKSVLDVIPAKITNKGAKFFGVCNSIVEIEFRNDKLIIWHMSLSWNSKEKEMKTTLLGCYAFNYKKFRTLVKSE